MKKVMIALLVLSACGTAVFAADTVKVGSVGLGIAMPMGDLKDLVKGGMGFGLEYEGYKYSDTITFGGSYFYTSSKMKTGATLGTGTASSNVTWSNWGLTPYAKITKEVDLAGKKCTAYGMFGLGLYSSAASISGFSVSSNDIGFNLGGGIMYPLNDKMQLGFDLKFHDIMASDVTETYLVPGAKFTYNF